MGAGAGPRLTVSVCMGTSLAPACLFPTPTYPLILFGVLPSLSATWGIFLRAVQAGPASPLAWLSSWDAGPPRRGECLHLPRSLSQALLLPGSSPWFCSGLGPFLHFS